MILIVCDIITGLFCAIASKTLNSTTSFRGMTRKAVMFIIIGMAATIEPFTGEIPLARLVALFYCIAEVISILENAAMLGVPLPKILVDSVEKLRKASDGHKIRKRAHAEFKVDIVQPDEDEENNHNTKL